MGRTKKNETEKKTKVSIALDLDILTFYRTKHINLSSLVNKLLNDYRENEYKKMS